MAPSVTVPNAMAQHIHSVIRDGRFHLPRAFRSFSSAGASSERRPGRAAAVSRTRITAATPKCATIDEVAAFMPEARSAASNEPPLKVACSLAMVLRSCRDSRAAPCAFMATFRHPTKTPSTPMTSSATG